MHIDKTTKVVVSSSVLLVRPFDGKLVADFRPMHESLSVGFEEAAAYCDLAARSINEHELLMSALQALEQCRNALNRTRPHLQGVIHSETEFAVGLADTAITNYKQRNQ